PAGRARRVSRGRTLLGGRGAVGGPRLPERPRGPPRGHRPEARPPVSEVTIAERYHEETKYSPEGVASRQHQLDFSKKPDRWKDYDGREQIMLGPHLGLGGPTLQDALSAFPLPDLSARAPGLAHAARLLFFTNGVTRVIPQPGSVPFLMRAS